MLSATGMIMALTAGAASAGDPVQLADLELDTVTAGVDVGAVLTTATVVNGGLFGPFTNPSTASGPHFSAIASTDGAGNSAFGTIDGELTVNDSFSLFKTATGVYDVETGTEGNGQVFVDAQPLVQNGTPAIAERAFIQTGPNTGIFVTWAAGFN
jgi:hypothetical protein